MVVADRAERKGDGHRDSVPPGNVGTVEGYDAVILGSAVYMGHWLAPAKEFVTRFRDTLARVRCGSSPADRRPAS
jgi:menaquinone-dependent protoporphyrinogen oxidase